MHYLPNILSLLRIPLALFFLQTNPWIRCAAIFGAMATDFLDGFLARRYRLVNRLGTYLDPITDKFFVLFVLAVYVYELKLTTTEALYFLCRDFSVILYAIYLLTASRFSSYKVESIICGKITTTLQFVLLMALTFGVAIPSFFYTTLCWLGFLSLIELYYFDTSRSKLSTK